MVAVYKLRKHFRNITCSLIFTAQILSFSIIVERFYNVARICNMTNRRYDILEYKLEKENTSLFPILRLPLVVIILIVISWNFSMLPIRCGLYVIIVTILITYLYAWNTVVAGKEDS